MADIAVIDRRGVMMGGTAATLAMTSGPISAAVAKRPAAPSMRSSWPSFRLEPAQTDWTGEPQQAPVIERMIDVGGVKLWTWDTGGPGEPVVLMHAYTGSGATWAYQQPILVQAGYRVIGYSRRGHFRSERGPEASTGRVVDDLHSIVTQLGLARFHLVGTAAGAFNLSDYALSHPEKLLSLTIASSLGGVDEPAFIATTEKLLPPGWRDLPPEFREIGPSYRAANPAGVKRWLELEATATNGPRLEQAKVNHISWAALHSIATPILMMTGDADLYFPPARLREAATHLQAGRTALIAEAGHAAFWEQPRAFNRLLLDHLALVSGRS